ncbi:MAG: S9 family peptidase [Anaerolineae bacterium]|nr:S9 family peptidase [Anaerolineae bacterium]
MTTLIPRSVIFGNPDRITVQISPDGKWLSYLAPHEGVLNLWVTPTINPSLAKPITHDKGRGIRQYQWAFTNQHIIYFQDTDGDENYRAFSVDVESRAVMPLTPLDNVRVIPIHACADFPTEILIGINDRMPQLHDVYRLDILTGERTLVQENPGFAGFVADDHYNIRLGVQQRPDGGMNILRPAGDGWELFLDVPNEDMLTTNPISFDHVGETLYLADSRGRNTSALMHLNMATGESVLLTEDPRADLTDVLRHPVTHQVQAAAFTYERKQWHVLDTDLQADFDYLKTVADGELSINSRTLHDQQWIVDFELDNGPVRYYRYDRAARQATFLFAHRDELERYQLAKMHPVVIPARDGQSLVSYYSLPVGTDTRETGIPDHPLPMVLFVHGGPWGRDFWGYNGIHQWLANRGYAVLSVNFRASTGFGKAFTNAGDKQWGRAMHDDLLDAVAWAVEAGLTTRDQVAIMGGSYGGYATLAGLTMTPDAFACGVDIVGPSNLITLLESVPPYWEPMIALFRQRVGDNTTDEGRALLKERSPLTYVESIRRPLLVGQGKNDPRVKQAESDQIVNAMHANNIPVTYVLYPDEGHGFARPENNLSFFAVTESFLAAHLEGSYQPIGDDFAKSSITILAGAEQIPGVADAWAALQRNA